MTKQTIFSGAFMLVIFAVIGFYMGFHGTDPASAMNTALQTMYDERDLAHGFSCQYIGNLTELCFSGSKEDCTLLATEQARHRMLFNVDDVQQDCTGKQRMAASSSSSSSVTLPIPLDQRGDENPIQ